MKTIDQHVEEVMDYFDFNKVKTVMDFLDWKWSDGNGGMSVPEIADMRGLVRKYMRDLYSRFKDEKEVNTYAGSGGFTIRYVKDIEDGEPWDHFLVDFSVSHWYTGE